MKFLKNILKSSEKNAEVEQAMKECELTIGMTVKEAVEKQIPKKPKNKYTDILDITTEIPACPVCGNQSIDETDEYCSDCGQALDWGNENDL